MCYGFDTSTRPTLPTECDLKCTQYEMSYWHASLLFSFWQITAAVDIVFLPTRGMTGLHVTKLIKQIFIPWQDAQICGVVKPPKKEQVCEKKYDVQTRRCYVPGTNLLLLISWKSCEKVIDLNVSMLVPM